MSEIAYVKAAKDGNMPPAYPDTKQGDDGHPHIGYSPNGYPPQESSPLVGTQGVMEQTKRAKDYLIFTIIVMAIFGIFGGGIGTVLAIPALICSLKARRKNDLGNYQDAKKCGVLALFCNLAVIIFHVILWIIVIVIIIVYATGGLSNAGTGSSSSDTNPGSQCRVTYTYYCVVTCGYKPRWTCD